MNCYLFIMLRYAIVLDYSPPYNGGYPPGASESGHRLQGIVTNAGRYEELWRVTRTQPVIAICLGYTPSAVQIEAESFYLYSKFHMTIK